MDQTYIPHAMAYAACIGPYKDHCDRKLKNVHFDKSRPSKSYFKKKFQYFLANETISYKYTHSISIIISFVVVSFILTIF